MEEESDHLGILGSAYYSDADYDYVATHRPVSHDELVARHVGLEDVHVVNLCLSRITETM